MKLELINTNLKRYTFESIKIKNWIESNCNGFVLNLFAGKVRLNVNEIRVDLNNKLNPDFCMDAFDFVNSYNGKLFDTVILDPPYSYRKSMEMYNGNYSSRFKLIANKLPDIIKPSARIISLGYHSTFLGKSRGYELEKLCVFAHGGAQHCTIGIIERKTI